MAAAIDAERASDDEDDALLHRLREERLALVALGQGRPQEEPALWLTPRQPIAELLAQRVLQHVAAQSVQLSQRRGLAREDTSHDRLVDDALVEDAAHQIHGLLRGVKALDDRRRRRDPRDAEAGGERL